MEVKKKGQKTLVIFDGDAEVIKVKDNIYVIITAGKEKRSLLEKLWRIPYRDRYLEALNLSLEEKEELKMLIKKGKIRLRKKYNKTFLDIPAVVYDELRRAEKHEQQEAVGLGFDYIITADKECIKKLDPQNYVILPGFDGKVYAMRRDVFNQLSRQIMKLKLREFDVSLVAKRLGIPEDKAYVALRILAEEGHFIEKRKGIFVPV